MARKSSHTFVQSKMNKDLDARLLEAGQYRDGVNVSVSRSEGQDVGALENILGNEFLSDFNIPNSVGDNNPLNIIGWRFYIEADLIFVFVTNYQDNSEDKISNLAPYNTYHAIAAYNTVDKTSKVIVEGSFLNFSINSRINDVDIIEDLLFWTDNRNQPRKINWKTALEDPSYYYNEDHISVAKYYPYEPLDLVDELVFSEQAIYMFGTTGDGQFNDCGEPSNRYDAHNSFFVFPFDPTQEQIDKIKKLIGARAYVLGKRSFNNDPPEKGKDAFVRYEFKVCWFQKDGEDQYGNSIPTRLPGNMAGKYMLFIDREISASPGQGILYSDSTTPGVGDGGRIPYENQYQIVVLNETCVDVFNPWEDNQIAKIQVKEMNFLNNADPTTPSVTYVGGTVGSVPTYDVLLSNVLSQVCLYGTRSTVRDLLNEWDEDCPSAPTPLNYPESYLPLEFPAFWVKDGFTKNLQLLVTDDPALSARNILPRIKHPKIPESDICCVSLTRLEDATGVRSLGFYTVILKNTEETRLYDPVDLVTEYNIQVDDILEIYLPNQNYDQEFVGDEVFLEDKFVRFSYRYKFDDGEYSVIAPFTQPVFIPKQNGYFESKINLGGVTSGGFSNGQILTYDVMSAGQSTIVDFFENKVSRVGLKINLAYRANSLFDKLKVVEIDILYKESSQNILKVIETLDIDDYSTSTDDFINYEYLGKKPIKALESSELSRVYDNVPVRAKTQSTSGNRIIYGNFFDKHTSPISLNYTVGASSKFTQAFPESTNSVVRYPNHTLKQNRSYQVGIVLQDRYGRSTDVILGPENLTYFNNAFNGDPSNIGDSQPFAKRFKNSRIEFKGDTVYHPYFFNTKHLYKYGEAKNLQQFNSLGGIPTTTAFGDFNIMDSVNPRAGLPDWPGDSLKVLFTNKIPASISRTGYPGLYEEFINNFIIKTVTVPGSTFECDEEWSIEVPIGSPIDFKPGLIVRWVDSGNLTTFEGDIKGVQKSDDGVTITYTIGINLKDPLFPSNLAEGDFVELLKYNPLGFYSGKFVVKQQEQTYYNVYLPSLLKGNPLVKPFKLNLKATTGGSPSNILVVDDSLHPTPQTFPILEGMYLPGITSTVIGQSKVTVVNILNETQFEVSQPVTIAADAEFEFKLDSNENTLNVTTLLTDNANKVPPSLNETTPVQQQYSTSDTRLIPRVALNNVSPISIGPNIATTVPNEPVVPPYDYTFPIYPGKTSLKVRSIGNFESMFVDGKYAGLWQADTNPPTAVIENKFDLGRVSSTAVNPPGEVLQPAIYETTPTFSQLEIFYESSTSFNVTDLNKTIEQRFATVDVSQGEAVFPELSKKYNTPFPILEVDFYNSYWMKSIFTSQPAQQVRVFDAGTYQSVGVNPSRGVWPLTNQLYAPTMKTQEYPSPGIFLTPNSDLRDQNWYIEESFIRGGYNNTETDLGARAFLDKDEPIQQHRFNALIYSGVFNSRTGINRTNEFPTGQVLTRAANPENGAIQKIYAEEGNLLVLQEDKCNRALIDKDTIYTAEGGTQTQAAGTVIGQITPYKGQYGISENPESFAIYGFRKYFADVNRSCMLRLSHDGLTEISEYGMRDWFRDNLANINNKFTNEFSYLMVVSGLTPAVPISYCNYDTVTYSTGDILANVLLGSELYRDNGAGGYDPTGIFVNEVTDGTIYLSDLVIDGWSEGGKVAFVSKNRSYIAGGWDIYNKQYVCSLQYNNTSSRNYIDTNNPGSKDYEFYTLGFDETTSGWTSFYTFRPGLMSSLKNVFYTINNFYDTYQTTGVGDFGLYKHYADNNTFTNRGTFYGNQQPSSVTIIANAGPSVQKTFIAIDYEGGNGWETNFMISDSTGYESPQDYYEDKAQFIASYNNGAYVDQYTGNTLRAGYDRKDNRYVANIVNQSGDSGLVPGQVLIGEDVTGIKGYYCEIKMSTDDATDVGGMKELYQVSATYNISAT